LVCRISYFIVFGVVESFPDVLVLGRWLHTILKCLNWAVDIVFVVWNDVGLDCACWSDVLLDRSVLHLVDVWRLQCRSESSWSGLAGE
jgi:hypothetical protein